MNDICRLDKSHIQEIALVDMESEHKKNRVQNITITDMRSEITKRIQQKHEIFFGLKIDKELVGYVTLKPFFPGHKHCEVYWLAVKKKYQEQGIGSQLMDFIESFAKRRGFRKIFLYTGKDMEHARQFYERSGYAFVNEFPGYYGYPTGETTAVLYGKSLK